MKTSDFANQLTNYLSIYLPGQRGISANTISSYIDTFKLFLTFCRDVLKLQPEKLKLKDYNAETISLFLDWLENERNNSVSTRNQRLAAVHAFCRYLQIEVPDQIAVLQKILCIPYKKYTKPQIGYLSLAEMTSLLAKPDIHTSSGRRDLAILSLLYDSGARVSELVDLHVRDIRLDEFPTVTLYGKGQKIRHVPIMHKTADILKKYISEQKLSTADKLDNILFTNNRHEKLTRAGVTYILKKYADDSSITPHILRHTKAMHLLQAGVNIVYIRDILGHTSVDTTSIYARADTEMKRKAIEKITNDPAPQIPDWTSDNALLEWLNNLK